MEADRLAHGNAKLLVTKLAAGESLPFSLNPERHAWLQMAKGSATLIPISQQRADGGPTLNGTTLKQGDGAAVSEEGALTLTANEDAEVLLFDLA